MKSIKVRHLKHEFMPGIFERGHENDPQSPNMLNYSLSCSKKCRWTEGMILHNFIKIHNNGIMYHSTVKVNKLIRQNGEWVGSKEDLGDFYSKVPLDDKGEPIDKGYYVFNGDYVESDKWKHGDMVEWSKNKNGGQTRNWVSKIEPIVLPTNRFENILQPTDISVPYNELQIMLNNKTIVDLLSIRGLYMWTDGVNKYIGSAASEDMGLYSRINDYIRTGHGGNKKMIQENEKNNGFLKNCYFKVLSVFPSHYGLNDIQRAEANMKKEFNCSWN